MTQVPRWYIASVHSGFENKASQEIREQADKHNLSHLILDILIPKEDVLEIKKGVKVSTEKKFFPGYIMIQMILTDDVWHLIKNTHKVSGFLGSKEKPFPVTQKEVDRIVGQVHNRAQTSQDQIFFDIGEKIRVCDGPFTSFIGLVEEVDHEKNRLKVSVSIFGRATPVDLDFSQVEKN